MSSDGIRRQIDVTAAESANADDGLRESLRKQQDVIDEQRKLRAAQKSLERLSAGHASERPADEAAKPFLQADLLAKNDDDD
jgi:hypothetical protein